MTVLEVGQRKRYYLLLLPSIFFTATIPLSLLFVSVLGLGSIGVLLGVLASLFLTLLAYLMTR